MPYSRQFAVLFFSVWALACASDEEPPASTLCCDAVVPEGLLRAPCGGYGCVEGVGYLCLGPGQAVRDAMGCRVDASVPEPPADVPEPLEMLPRRPPPAECLSDARCENDEDCRGLAGTRCNVALERPVCQKIRCGREGGICVPGEDVLCPDGMSCFSGAARRGSRDAATNAST